MKKKKKLTKKKHNKKRNNDTTRGELAMASGEPITRLGPDEAGGALLAALEQASRLGVRVAVDGHGYTLLHGRAERRCGKVNLCGVVVRRTPARRERAAATPVA